MRTGVLALTGGGRKLAATITGKLSNCQIIPVEQGIAAAFRDNWQSYDGFIAIMASGIVVRTIASLLGDKKSDPAIVCLDEKGNHVISLLSGHLGGGNSLAREVAKATGGVAVITTSSDTLGLAAIDLWTAAQHLRAEGDELTRASSMLVNSGRLRVYSEVEIQELPQGLLAVDDIEEADLIVSHRLFPEEKIVLHPANLVIGIGCNRNTPLEEFEEALAELFTDLNFSAQAIRNLASIDVKCDERGLLQFARKHGLSVKFFSSDEINTVSDVAVSSAALKAVGAQGVAEPTALLSAQTTTLLSRKRKWQNITMAVARAPFTLSAQVLDHLNT